VFISFRFCENIDGAAQKLQERLERRGINTFVCDPAEGTNIIEHVGAALDSCTLFVVLGTETYGENTSSYGFSTYSELEYAVGRKKNIFLIKRCDDFQVVSTRLWLPFTKLHAVWAPSTDIPEDLIDKIVLCTTKLKGLSV
jgi:hypothetical protein